MQQQKVATGKRFFSAEEVARELNVKKFLVKFWEKEFKLHPEHLSGGARCYSQENLKVFGAIKDLVHNQKMSLSQAKKQIKTILSERAENDFAEQQAASIADEVATHQGRQEDSFVAAQQEGAEQSDLFMQNLSTFKEQLINFKQLLDLD